MIDRFIRWLKRPSSNNFETTAKRIPVTIQQGEVYLWLTDIQRGIILQVDDAKDVSDRISRAVDGYLQDPDCSLVLLSGD